MSGSRRALIARAAAEVNLTSRKVYNLLKRYAAERTVSSLMPRRGNARAKRLKVSVEAIIAATLNEQWLVGEAPPLVPVVEEIRARCSAASERPPSYIAVQTRIPLLFDAMTIAKARSANPSMCGGSSRGPATRRIRSRSVRSTTRPPTSTSSKSSTMPACLSAGLI